MYKIKHVSGDDRVSGNGNVVTAHGSAQRLPYSVTVTVTAAVTVTVNGSVCRLAVGYGLVQQATSNC